MTKEDRINRAIELHGRGYNCAQCVLMSLSDLTGIDEGSAAAISTGFGSGLAGLGEVCGVVSAMAMAGSLVDSHDVADKRKVYANIREAVKVFSERNNGCVRCADLKRPPQVRSCSQLICDGVEIMSDSLEKK